MTLTDEKRKDEKRKLVRLIYDIGCLESTSPSTKMMVAKIIDFLREKRNEIPAGIMESMTPADVQELRDEMEEEIKNNMNCE